MPLAARDPRLAAALLRYVLRLGDTSLVLGQRLGAWVGHAPALEEDLGLANLALDLIGQARLLLTYAGELEGRGRDEDALAFLRDAPAFANLTLAEHERIVTEAQEIFDAHGVGRVHLRFARH